MIREGRGEEGGGKGRVEGERRERGRERKGEEEMRKRLRKEKGEGVIFQQVTSDLVLLLRTVTNEAASNALKKKAIKKLEIAAKQAAAVATQCIAAAQGARAFNCNEASQTQLINHCKAVAEQISALVQSVRSSMANPDSPSTQLGLINSSQAMIPVSVCV